MHPISRAAIALTAASIAIAPVAASAAPAIDGARAVSATNGEGLDEIWRVIASVAKGDAD